MCMPSLWKPSLKDPVYAPVYSDVLTLIAHVQ